MSYSYSYKSSSNTGGPGGSSYSYQSSGPSGSSSYHYESSSSSSGAPRLGNDAEFQAAKMQAMMGAPMTGPTGNSSSYSYKSSSSSGTAAPHMHTGMVGTNMDAEMARMKHEAESAMRPVGGGSSSYSYKSESSSSGGHTVPKLIHPETSNTSGGKTVKKVVTTTTTQSNPQAVRELESIERDFNRIGCTPDNYSDDFDKIKKEIMTREAYKGDTSIQQPVSTRMREEYSKSSSGIPVPIGRNNGLHETTTTTTTRSYGSAGPSVTEEKIVRSSSAGTHHQPGSLQTETFIPIKTYDNTFDDFYMNRWMDHKDHFNNFGAHDLDMHRLDWQNNLGGIKRNFFSMSPQSGISTIDSSRTVAKNPLGKPEFAVQFEMRDFKPEDISIQTRHGKLIINATREERVGSSTSRREFSRTVDLPSDVQINFMRSVYSRDGILSVTAPIKPPQYDPMHH